jgi:hypothetical protein
MTTIRRLRAVAATVAIAMMALAVESAQAQGATGGRGVKIGRDSAADRVVRTVYQGTFSFVRIERAEPQAAANLHPFSITPEALRSALASVRKADSGKSEVFNDEELTEIAAPLAQALGQAGPDQEVSFAVAGRHTWFGPLAPRTVTTGRVFRNADGLQVILGYVQKPFESEYAATGYLIPFEPGRRAAPVDSSVRVALDGGGSVRRADWVTLVAATAPAAPAATAAPAAPAAAPAAVAVPAAAAPTGAPAASKPRDAAFFEEQELRLKTLRRLRDQNLITEEEYQQKRREVLQNL